MFFNLLCGVFVVVVVGLFLFRILAVNSVLVFFFFFLALLQIVTVLQIFFCHQFISETVPKKLKTDQADVSKNSNSTGD